MRTHFGLTLGGAISAAIIVACAGAPSDEGLPGGGAVSATAPGITAAVAVPDASPPAREWTMEEETGPRDFTYSVESEEVALVAGNGYVVRHKLYLFCTNGQVEVALNVWAEVKALAANSLFSEGDESTGTVPRGGERLEKRTGYLILPKRTWLAALSRHEGQSVTFRVDTANRGSPSVKFSLRGVSAAIQDLRQRCK